MQLKGFLKRIVPFFLTFAFGLLIASFFVSIAAPNFQFKKRNHRWREFQENNRLRTENERLRQENGMLKRQMDAQQIKTLHVTDLNAESAPPPPMPPLAPIAPRISR